MKSEIKREYNNMSNSWYKKLMPRVQDIKKQLPEMATQIKKIDGVKSVYICGSYIENEKKPDYVLRDIDIIAEVDIPSEDLLAITDNTDGQIFNMTKGELEEDGFNPTAINFTKKFTSLCENNVDHWAISSNNQLLHLGPIHDNLEDWEEAKEKSERYANVGTGSKRQKLAKQKTKDDWYQRFKEQFNLSFAGSPFGWYKSSLTKSDIIKKIQKL